MDFIAVNGEEIMDTKSAIIDSGIRFLIRETETVRQLMTGVDGAKDGAETIAPGFWSSESFFFECRSFLMTLRCSSM